MVTSPQIRELIERSQAQERNGQISTALSTARCAAESAQQAGDLLLHAQAVLSQAQCYYRLGSYDQTNELCQQTLDRLPANSKDAALCAVRGDALRLLGITALEVGDIDGGSAYLHQVVALTREIGCNTLLARALHNLSAGVYTPRGQFDLSLKTDQEAIDLFQKLEMASALWAPMLTIAWVNLLTGRFEQVAEQLAHLEPHILPGSLGETWVYILRSELALAENDLPRADKLLNRLFSLSEQLGAPESRFYARLVRARYCRLSGDAPSALAWACEALAVADQVRYTHLIGIAWIERSRAAWALSDLPAAEAALHAAIHHLSSQKLDFDLAIAQLLLAALLRHQASPLAAPAWQEACTRLMLGGFACLADRERTLAFPLIIDGLNHPDKTIAQASATLLEHLQRTPPPPLKIATLGGWQVRIGGRAVEKQALRQRRAGELLGLLLISTGHTLSIDQVMETLWPEKEASSAQVLFHHATSTLRRVLEPELPEKFPSRYLEVADGKVELRLPPFSQVDYEAFTEHIRQEDWPAALACYGGDFLPEYRYADWAAPQRQWLIQDHQHALLEMAAAWLAEGHHTEALHACRKIIASEPWQEHAVLLGMRACLSAGDPTSALRLYKALEKTLRSELDIEPQADLQTLYHHLLKHR